MVFDFGKFFHEIGASNVINLFLKKKNKNQNMKKNKTTERENQGEQEDFH